MRKFLLLAVASLAISLPASATSSSIGSNFNGTAISAGNDIWFNSVFKVSGLNSAQTTTVFLTNSTITFSANSVNYSLNVPNSVITFSPTATMSTASFNTALNQWEITAPVSGLSGNVFLSGLKFLVPSGGLPGGINPVSWSGNFSASQSGLSINWQWAASVYTNSPSSMDGSTYNGLGVKPIDDNTGSAYLNSDHAGTPEDFKNQLAGGGARGGGGSNYTGSYSGTATSTPDLFVPSVPEPATMFLFFSGGVAAVIRRRGLRKQ